MRPCIPPCVIGLPVTQAWASRSLQPRNTETIVLATTVSHIMTEKNESQGSSREKLESSGSIGSIGRVVFMERHADVTHA